MCQIFARLSEGFPSLFETPSRGAEMKSICSPHLLYYFLPYNHGQMLVTVKTAPSSYLSIPLTSLNTSPIPPNIAQDYLKLQFLALCRGIYLSGERNRENGPEPVHRSPIDYVRVLKGWGVEEISFRLGGGGTIFM